MSKFSKDHQPVHVQEVMDDALRGDESLTDEEVAPQHRKTPEDVLHPDSASLFARFAWVRRIPIVGGTIAVFGPRCVMSLSLSYFSDKGLGFNLINYAKYAMFTDRFSTSADRYQRLSNIVILGFSIKALPAGLSDMFACAGYTKRWYLAAACVVGGAFTLGFGLLPAKPSSADIGAGFSFLASFCVAIVDILSEGHYSRLMRRHPKAGTALVGSIWWFMLAAQLIAAAIQGPLSDAKMPQVGLFISAAAQVAPTIFFILNWYGEKTNREERLEDARSEYLRWKEFEKAAKAEEKVREDDLVLKTAPDAAVDAVEARQEGHDHHDHLDDEVPAITPATIVAQVYAEDEDDFGDFVEPTIIPCLCGAFEFNKEVFVRHWRILAFSCLLVCATVAVTCVTILGNTWDLLYCAVVVTVVINSTVFWACPFIVARVALFVFADRLLYLQLPGALDNFYMAKASCYPDGPHFTYVFYTSVASIIGSFAGMVGVAAFNYIFSHQYYAFTFVVTTLVKILASIFDIVMVKRWNLAIGIPDHAMYIMGDAVIFQIVYFVSWMPLTVMLSRVCPRGSESVVYAIVAGFSNMGFSLSGVIGSILLERVWPVVSRGIGKCDFSNVPMLLLVGHILLPLLVIPLSFLLLPAARVSDNLDVDGKPVKPIMREAQTESTQEPMASSR